MQCLSEQAVAYVSERVFLQLAQKCTHVLESANAGETDAGEVVVRFRNSPCLRHHRSIKGERSRERMRQLVDVRCDLGVGFSWKVEAVLERVEPGTVASLNRTRPGTALRIEAVSDDLPDGCHG